MKAGKGFCLYNQKTFPRFWPVAGLQISKRYIQKIQEKSLRAHVESYTSKEVTAYSYDDLGRLVSEIETAGDSISYTYDDYNNRKTMTKNGVETGYEYDRNNRLVTETKAEGDVTQTTRYTYDPNGNQTYKAAEKLQLYTGQLEEYGAYVLGEDMESSILTINEYDGSTGLKVSVKGCNGRIQVQ